MERDASKLAAGTDLEADLCIVGAGPAGLTLANEFIGSNLDVVVLESGGNHLDRELQELNDGSVEGDPYDGLRPTRHRQVGGTTNIWNTLVNDRMGGKFAPLDPHDLERRDGSLSEWPFGYAELEAYYTRAQDRCGLGPFAYDAGQWSKELGPAPTLGSRLLNRVYQFGTTGPFAQTYRALQRAGNIRVLLHASALRLETERGRRRVVAMQAANRGGTGFRVRARAVVFAAGAIENARLLLVSKDRLTLGESEAWVGQCFMEHPRDTSLSLVPHSPETVAFYRRQTTPGDLVVGGRVAIGAETIRQERVPNASVSLIPIVASKPQGLQGLLHRLIGRKSAEPERYGVLINLEQAPHRENRIVLGSKQDSLGLPRLVLRWRWRAEEQAGVERLRRLLQSGLAELGAVSEEPSPVDPNAHHHAGTTRMHADPAYGVVDPTGRVHGVDNLYIAGASVLPTSGWANPTLTIVALALRLADQLKRGF